MNLLPSMLIAATLVGGSGNIKVDLSSINMQNFPNQFTGNCVSSQVFFGTSAELKAILQDLGINADFLPDCILPEIPGAKPEAPDSGAETPDAKPETPDSGTQTPDAKPETPDSGTQTPDAKPETPDSGAETPDAKPEAPDSGAETPGAKPETPDSGAQTPDAKPETPDSGTQTPDAKPETPAPNLPGNDSNDTEQDTALSYVEQVVALVNVERAKYGLPALTMSQELNHTAQIRAKEIVQSFSHTRPNGSSFSSVLKENGISYRGSGENIAWGQRTPEAVVNAWMNSEGHRANILNKNYTAIGIGYHLNGSTPYWAQLFTY